MGGYLWDIFQPSNSFIFLATGGIALAWAGWRRVGLGLSTAGLIGLILWATSPVSGIMMRHLESRFPIPQTLPETIAGIIVVGGGVRPPVTEETGQPALNERAERLTAAVPLARRYPDVPIAFTGGRWSMSEATLSEADVAMLFFTEMGIDANRLILEDRARNTHENAVLLSRILPDKADAPWIVITSAYHMPRVVGAFRTSGVSILPYPVDHQSSREEGLWFEIAVGAESADFAAREWVALTVYHLRGWTDRWIPAAAP